MHSGALYFATDEDGLVQMDVDLRLQYLRASGIQITKDLKAQIKKEVKASKNEYHDRVNHIGIPDKLKDIFEIANKTNAEHLLHDIELSEYDLFLLIHNCNQIQFTHRSKFKQHIPEHLKVLKTDTEQLKLGNPKKALKKVHSGLIERRYVHVHLFERSSEWHFFYFSHQDIENTKFNHWKCGPHIHYVSHLWPQLNKRLLWNKFNKRNAVISGSIHMKFHPFEFPDIDVARNPSLMNSQQRSSSIIYNPDLANGYDSYLLPVAQLKTRGVWITKAFPQLK